MYILNPTLVLRRSRPRCVGVKGTVDIAWQWGRGFGSATLDLQVSDSRRGEQTHGRKQNGWALYIYGTRGFRFTLGQNDAGKTVMAVTASLHCFTTGCVGGWGMRQPFLDYTGDVADCRKQRTRDRRRSGEALQPDLRDLYCSKGMAMGGARKYAQGKDHKYSFVSLLVGLQGTTTV